MKILVAPDSFKGSLSAQEFCQIAEQAILKLMPKAQVLSMPLADGGEGTVDALVNNTQGRLEIRQVTGPLGQPVQASFGILGDGKTAVIEMAQASGLPLVPREQRNPMVTTTYGTGELIQAALDLGCTTIIMGIGGSATNDGGAGMLQALGFGLLDQEGQPIGFGGRGLVELARFDLSTRDQRLDQVKFLVACDVNNPLYGPNGAAAVYGPQKGATPKMVTRLDQGLRRFADLIESNLGQSIAEIPGVGAAGGLGAGLMAFLHAELASGFEIIQETIQLEQVFQENQIDLVITGEGEMNGQTAHGKLPVGVAQMAKKYGVLVVAIVGGIGPGVEQVYDAGIDSIFPIVNGPLSLSAAMDKVRPLLADTIQRVLRFWIATQKNKQN